MSLRRSLIHWHCWFYKDASPTDFAAFAPFARRKINRPVPHSSTPNCHWPVFAHGHQLGHCWGARPSRWPFPASRRGRDGALRRPPARAFLSPAGRRKFRWPKTGKRQRGHRRAMSLPIPTGLNHSAQGCAGALPWVHVR